MPQIKTVSKTKACLIALAENLEEQGSLWANFMIGATHPFYRRTFMGGGPEAVRRRRRREAEYAYRQHLLKLKRQQWIVMRRIGGEIQVALTPRGKVMALRERMKTASACKDKECVIVIFDIPEKERVVREQFRSVLKECGFTQLQRSVWMSTNNVLAHLKEFIRHTKSHSWIRAFHTKDIESD
ncbi:CRISPR-associated endonuclease Cas2 [Candidatus Uhrbacteria bacterium]|nr:CRISPR-associated endonuclease Cas2 [Candidatus Uhrbacteria bacterium]